MKVYLLNIDYYYKDTDCSEYEIEVYTSLERAVAEGVHFLSKRSKDDGFVDYDFTVTEIDPEYAERFNSKKLDIRICHSEDCGKYEPTHIIYTYNKDGELQYQYLEYRENQRKHLAGFTVFPEDEDAMAGQKFKVGDIVRIKKRNIEEYYPLNFIKSWSREKLYVIKQLPCKADGKKYFENTYAVISIYTDVNTQKLNTFEVYERDIELANVELADDSPIKFLQKIIKNEIAISKETWSKLKCGIIQLDEVQLLEDDLFLRSTISPRESGLKTNIYLMEDGKDGIWGPEPKVKVQLKNAETFTVLLEPEVHPANIEEYNALESNNKSIVDNAIDYIKNNIDIVLRYWNGKFDEYELHNILNEMEQ